MKITEQLTEELDRWYRNGSPQAMSSHIAELNPLVKKWNDEAKKITDLIKSMSQVIAKDVATAKAGKLDEDSLNILIDQVDGSLLLLQRTYEGLKKEEGLIGGWG